MFELRNPLRDRLASGQIALGMNVRHSRTSEIGPILADCGYHWLMVDDEHSPMPSGVAYEIMLAAIRAGVCPVARPRTKDHAQIGSQLTNGALGVMLAHIGSAEEALVTTRATRYAPEGDLSVPGSITQLGYRKMPLQEATAAFNKVVMAIAMIESPDAVEQVEAIAAVPFVDVLFVGASDLTWDMGIPGQYGHERVVAVVDRICRAARANGKYVGIGGVKEDRDWVRYIELGVRMIMTENDLTMMTTRMVERAQHYLGLAGR